MKRRQHGFAHLHMLLFAVVIVGVVLVGWFVVRQNSGGNNKDANKVPTAQQQTQEESTDQTQPEANEETVSPAEEAAAKPSDPTDWTVINKSTVNLLDWGIKVSLPDELAGKITYRLKSDASPYQGAEPTVEAFQFSTKKIVDDDKCMGFFSEGREGVLLYRFSPKTAGAGLVYDEDVIKEKLTLDEYYNKYKAGSSNYFVKKRGLGNYNWYKVGNYFYTFGGHITAYIDDNEWNTEFSSTCKKESPDFYKPFLSTVVPSAQ